MTAPETMTWQQVWREGIAPQFDREQLLALADALRTDDARLLQGATTEPPPLLCVQDWPCKGGCPIAYAGVQALGGFGAVTVGAVEEFFAVACHDCGVRMGVPAAERFFLNAWDDTPRDEMRRELLAEVELALAGKVAA